jgi:hypothetical protein
VVSTAAVFAAFSNRVIDTAALSLIDTAAYRFPFGVGDYHQEADEQSLFRFVLHDGAGTAAGAKW